VTSPLRFTLDSNILVYAADASEPVRQAAAIDIVARAARRDCVLTPQSLAEFFHAITRKRIVPVAEAARQVQAWAMVFPITQGAGEAALLTAVEEAEAGRLQLFDALLLATAHEAGCGAVISEDMGEHTRLNGVRVIAAFDRHGGISSAALALL
jgi:predicted nucleic acid-binding protein